MDISALVPQLRGTLPGGGSYLHKLFAWPGFGFCLEKLSTVALGVDLEKIAIFDVENQV